jgi:type VI secretion system protein ImpJ
MKQLQPVIWAKGTFLEPQHLQTQDRYFESLLHFRQEVLRFAPYGFRELIFSQEILAAGQLQIERASGLLGDGLAFAIPTSDASPEAKPLAPWFEPVQGIVPEHVDLFLAVPAYRTGGANLGRPNMNKDGRYVVDTLLVNDENSGLAQKPIQVARKNLRILTEYEIGEGMVSMRLARVKRNEAGQYYLDPKFVPPLLDFAASEYLMGLVRRTVELLAAKSANLSGMRRQKNLSLADFTSGDIANFWLLYTINTSLPLVRHAFESRHGHPEAMYAELTALAGALTTFSTDISPASLPVYQHDNLGECYGQLTAAIYTLLESTVPTNFVSIPLKLMQPSIYAAALDDEKLLRNTRFYLAVSSEINEGEVIQRTPILGKVCSATHIEHIVRNAMMGVQLTHLPVPPSTIPVKLNFQYFALNQTGGPWEAIQRSRNIALYAPSELALVKAEVIVVFPG